MIFDSFLKALGQLHDPKFLKVTLKGLALTFALLFAVYLGLVGLLGWLIPDTVSLPLIGEVSELGRAISIGSLFIMLGLSVFLMVPVASLFTGLFLDEVAQAVEAKHYPDLPPVSPLSWGEILSDTLRFMGVIIVANLFALIIYLLTNIAAPLVFWALNGFLLGREYFQMAAMRREGREGARALRRKHGLMIWAAGAVMAMGLSIPLVNLLIPVLGAATFTHIYMALSAKTTAQ